MRRTWIFSVLFLLMGSTAAWAAANRAPAGWGTSAKHNRHVRVVRDRSVKIRKHRLHAARTSSTSTSTTGVAAQLAGDPILFGDSTVESTRDSTGSGVGEAFAFANATAGTTASISVYVSSNSGASKLYAAVYTDNSKHPGSLVASGSLSRPKSGAWNNVPVPSAVVYPGRTYWVAVLGTGGTLRFRDRNSGTCVSEISSQTRLGSLPSTWKVGTQYGECPASAYVNGYLIAAPSNTVLPHVSGTTTQGQTLNTDNGTWTASLTSYSYQWRQCDSAGNNCATVSGATGSSYTLASGDVGHTIRSLVTAANPGGTATATSNASATVAAIAPTASFTYAPASPQTGQAVHFDASASKCYATPCAYSWADSPAGGSSWPLGTGQTLDFTFQQAATKYVTLTVTDATNHTAVIEHDVVVSTPPASSPANTTPPAVTGTTSQGQTLSTDHGTWTGSPTAYSYQWRQCDSIGNNCANISGATTSSYTLASGDVSHTIRSAVTATNASGTTTATSNATATIAAFAPAPPANTTPPALSGTTAQGQTLSTDNGSWSGSPTGYAYKWQDCDSTGNTCTTITGAIGSTYTLTSGDVGHTVRSAVTATNAGGTTTATSKASAPVAAIAPTARFTYSPASPQTGQSVHFDASASTCYASPCTYSWADSPPSGGSWALGTGQTLDFTFTQAATKYVTLTVTDATSQTATVEHDVLVVSPPPSAPANTALPQVSGTTTQGHLLSSDSGAWTGSPTGYAYQWRQCDTVGNNCTNISGATTSSYTLAVGDVGHSLRTVVAATNVGGTTTATSSATPAVNPQQVAAPVNTAAPTVSGSTVQGSTLTASNGSWSGSPTYAYQWQNCASGTCSDINGAVNSTYTLGTGDVGKTIDVVVKATNAGGTASATSAQTAAVTAPSGTPKNCVGGAPGSKTVSFAALDACGYPSPNTTGVPAGTTLTSVSSVNCTNKTINAVVTTGSVTIGSNCTITNSRLMGGQITVGNTVTGVQLLHDEISGPYTGTPTNPTCTYTSTSGTSSNVLWTGAASGVLLQYDYLHCAAEPFNGNGVVKDSYLIADECWGPCGSSSTTHNEGVYIAGGGSGGSVLDHNTILNPWPQTAGIFGDDHAWGPIKNLTINNNLVAAGGDNGAIATGAAGDGNVNVNITNNRLSYVYNTSMAAGNSTAANWSGNFRDDTLATVAANG